MFIWIVVAVAVLGLATWAFWPHKHGVVDGDVRRARRLDRGKIENYNNHG